MAFVNAVIFLTTLSHINLASSNEASSISTQSVYQKVHYRVRDIVGMLQIMQQRVSKDGEEDTELFSKYMFYCRKGRKALENAIEQAEGTDLEGLKSAIEGEEVTREGIQETLEEDQAKQADAEAAIVKAKSLRDEEAALFKQEYKALHKQAETLKNMILSFEHGDGMEASRHLLGVPILKELSGCSDTKQQDRDFFKSFLQKVKDGVDVPEKEEMDVFAHAHKILDGQLTYLIGEERTEITDFREYKGLVQEKNRDLKSTIKEKKTEVEELDEEMTSQRDDLKDAAVYLMEGRAFLPFISASENCSRREDEWHKRCHVRTVELMTLTQTITTLTDDDFLDELFQKGLPMPWQDGAHHALLASKQSNKSDEKAESKFDLLSLALKGKNASFAKLLNVFDGMAAMLGKEQNTHPEKFCGQSINQTEDNLKKLTLTVSDLGTIVARHEKSIATLAKEIDVARADVQKLEQQVLETGKVRKQEHEQNSEVLTSDNMTLQLFGLARDRLQTYYSKEDPVESDAEGVTLGEVIGPYVKKVDESANIISMLETSVAELRYEMAKVEDQEKQNQEEWEKSIKHSIQEHARGTKSISDKQGEKAELEATHTSVDKEKREKMQEVKASKLYLSELQGEHKAFMKPTVCSRKPDNTKPTLPKHIPFW